VFLDGLPPGSLKKHGIRPKYVAWNTEARIENPLVGLVIHFRSLHRASQLFCTRTRGPQAYVLLMLVGHSAPQKLIGLGSSKLAR